MKTETFIREILAATLPLPNQGQYYPCLIVLLGGTAIRVGRHLKSWLVRHQVRHIRLLGVDCDRNEQARYPELPELTDSELVLLDPETAIRALERAKAGLGEQHILEFLPDEYQDLHNLHREVKSKIATGQGAGQCRRAGHLLACANATNGVGLKQRIDTIHQELLGMAPLINEAQAGNQLVNGTRVLIISSLSGGAGAGMLIALLALLRQKFTSVHDVFTLFGVLPGTLLDRELIHDPRREALATRGNAFGILGELESLQSGAYRTEVLKLDDHTSIPLRDVYLHNVFLVGQVNSRGTPANNYMDICRGLGCFLYSLVGEGFGASLASAEVNFTIQVHTIATGPKRVFSSLGVGAIEYPTFGLLSMALFVAQEHWLTQWLANTPGEYQANMDAAQETIQLIGLADSDALKAAIQGVAIPEATYLDDVNLREMMVKWPDSRDEEFIANGNNHRGGFDQRVAAHRPNFARNAEVIGQNARVTLNARFLSWLAQGVEVAQARLEQTRRVTDNLKAHMLAQARERSNAIAGLEAEIDSLAGEIRRRNWLPDTQQKREFIVKTNDWLAAKLNGTIEPYVTACLDAISAEMDALTSQLDNLRIRAVTELDVSQDILAKFVNRPDSKGIVQTVFSPTEIIDWVRAHRPEIPKMTAFQSPDFDQMRLEILRPMMETVRAAMDALDLVQNSRVDAALMRKIKSTQVAAVPLMQIVQTGPLMDDLVPKRLVTAKLQDGDDPYVKDNFDQPSTACITSNPNLIVCARTIHGFAAEDWAGFEEAKKAAAGCEWMHQVLPPPTPKNAS